MEVIYDINIPSGHVVASYNALVSAAGPLAQNYVWECRVCGYKTGGIADGHEAPSRIAAWAELGALCCPQPEVEVTIFSVVGGHSTRVVIGRGGVHCEVRSWCLHDGG